MVHMQILIPVNLESALETSPQERFILIDLLTLRPIGG